MYLRISQREENFRVLRLFQLWVVVAICFVCGVQECGATEQDTLPSVTSLALTERPPVPESPPISPRHRNIISKKAAVAAYNTVLAPGRFHTKPEHHEYFKKQLKEKHSLTEEINNQKALEMLLVDSAGAFGPLQNYFKGMQEQVAALLVYIVLLEECNKQRKEQLVTFHENYKKLENQKTTLTEQVEELSKKNKQKLQVIPQPEEEKKIVKKNTYAGVVWWNPIILVPIGIGILIPISLKYFRIWNW